MIYRKREGVKMFSAITPSDIRHTLIINCYGFGFEITSSV